MARPQKPHDQTRNRRLQVRFTLTEETSLRALAENRGLTISDFVRLTALSLKPRIQRATPYRAALVRGLSELGRISSNVNQIARALNRAQYGDQQRVPSEVITNTLHGLQTLSTHIIRILTNGDPGQD